MRGIPDVAGGDYVAVRVVVKRPAACQSFCSALMDTELHLSPALDRGDHQRRSICGGLCTADLAAPGPAARQRVDVDDGHLLQRASAWRR
ncbi:MAG: hypothetical protein R2911_16745 [Caldilineaceae bacterium]